MREYLLLLGVLLTAVTGSLRGYFAARLYKLLKGSRWRVLAIKLCLVTLLGMLLLTIIVVADHAEPDRFQAERSADTLFFGCLWGLIDVPAVLLGCYLGYVSERIKLPV